MTWSDWWDLVASPGELLSYRSAIAASFHHYPPRAFDLYGVGWSDHKNTRVVWRGIPTISTLDVAGSYRFYFALENHGDEDSLISERVWDALWGDAVPVYRGHHHIGNYIPKDCYIDARQFMRPKDLLDYLLGMSEAEWARYHDAGQDFVRSEAIEPFLPDAAASDLLTPILAITNDRQAYQPQRAAGAGRHQGESL